jgi:hypothetical protein
MIGDVLRITEYGKTVTILADLSDPSDARRCSKLP